MIGWLVDEFFEAIKENDVSKVRRIIRDNPDAANAVWKPRAWTDEETTPIFEAITLSNRSFLQSINEEILDLLIENGANINHIYNYGLRNSVLHLASEELRFHSRGPDSWVIINEDTTNRIISKLINAGAHLMSTNGEGRIPLQEAVLNKNVNVVKALLKYSSQELQERQMKATDPTGYTALDMARYAASQNMTDGQVILDILNGVNSDNNRTLNTSFNNTTDLTDLNMSQVVDETPSQNNDDFVYRTPEQSPRRVDTRVPFQNPNNEMSGENNSQSSQQSQQSQETQQSQSSMISRLSEKDVYKKVQDMQNKSRHPINITKDILFNDPIMQSEETINIAEYIAEDPDNIVLKYGNEKYFLI